MESSAETATRSDEVVAMMTTCMLAAWLNVEGSRDRSVKPLALRGPSPLHIR